ncbi:hypothetical protein CAEBREN_18610 [Caenorhabditis brenneri]|uniref:Uncharacterized protein n=1 Tax=Caenorhabditis brenneri TaxID=135651 RepID=G0NV20_CAEBE|nr:hypothetical protein CAEBREN_18610 [Caenorhabditis brenneri]
MSLTKHRCMETRHFFRISSHQRRVWKDSAADKKWMAEHPDGTLETLEIKRKTSEKVRKILGKKIVKEFDEGN